MKKLIFILGVLTGALLLIAIFRVVIYFILNHGWT